MPELDHDETTLTHADLIDVIEEAQPPAEPQTEIIDGWLVDVTTGEVIGRADIAPVFVIDTPDKADWTLRLRSETEGRKAGLLARKAAVIEQLDAMIKIEDRKLDWWYQRFAANLIEFARTILVGKSRIAQFMWGRVSFRSSAGTNTITDMGTAVEWMRRKDATRIKVKESVSASDVMKIKGDEWPRWLESSGPIEKATTSTGIETK